MFLDCNVFVVATTFYALFAKSHLWKERIALAYVVVIVPGFKNSYAKMGLKGLKICWNLPAKDDFSPTEAEPEVVPS